jgi:hypothetical protein
MGAIGGRDLGPQPMRRKLNANHAYYRRNRATGQPSQQQS